MNVESTSSLIIAFICTIWETITFISETMRCMGSHYLVSY